MNIKQFAVLVIAAIVIGIVAGSGIAYANGQNCPPSGESGWTKVDSGDLSSYPVAGADSYCFKVGTFIVGSIPAGGFGQEGACEADHVERCDLSHWAYHIPEPTRIPPTETPTDVPPTETPTEEPPTPTPTDDPPTPTSTPTPECEECETPTPTPETPTPTPTPTDPPKTSTPELPKTGNSPLETNYNAVWQEDYLPDNLYLAHNGMAAGPNIGLEWVMLRANTTYSSVYMGGVDYWITGRLIVDATDTWVLDIIEQYDGIVMMTCSQFMPEDGDPTRGYWAKRVIIFAQAIGQ